MRNYLDMLAYIRDNGTRQPNRTGVDAISVPGYMLKFDQRDGFPLVTTKKMAVKGIKGELKGFLTGSTSAADFRAFGCNIWNQNANEDGVDPFGNVVPNKWLTNPNRKGEDDLGHIYGYMWRKWPTTNWKDQVIEVQIRNDNTNADFVAPVNPIQVPSGVDDLTGKTFTNTDGCQYTVVDKCASTSKKNSTYLVQFASTTSLVEVSRPNLRSNQVRDPYSTIFNGHGCLGPVPIKKPPYYKKLYTMWYNMMKRCYDPSLAEYQLYGGRGVFVCQQWRCFSIFLQDVCNVPLFSEWFRTPHKFDLDKDYYGSSSYGPNTCIFLPKEYNVVLPYVSGAKYVATNKQTGIRYEFTVQSWGAKKLKIKHHQAISTALSQSPTASTKHWSFERVDSNPGYVYRQQMFIDQVQVAIDTIKKDPTSRRIIINAWRPDEFDQMALPPCHVLYQFIVDTTNGLLHLCMYQRSCDSYLGVPFNIASASMLQCIVAKLTGYTAGTFTHFLADAHLYVNQLEKVEYQLTLEPRPLPQLILSDRGWDIDTIMPDDIQFGGYDPHIWDSAVPMAV